MKSIFPFRPAVTGSCSLILAALVAGCSTTHPTPRPAVAEARPISAASIQRGLTLVDLTGGDLGIGGGFLLGAAPEKVENHMKDEALAAAQKAEQSPAPLQRVHDAQTADLNQDGYVTLDEVLAMARAGLNDAEISQRLRRTGYIFHMTPMQERYLTDRGVNDAVIETLRELSKGTPRA